MTKTVDAKDLLDLIDTEVIIWYLLNKNYIVNTPEELNNMKEVISDSVVGLHTCSDYQFQQEAIERNYYFPEYEKEADRIAELICQGKNWQDDAFKLIETITDRILPK